MRIMFMATKLPTSTILFLELASGLEVRSGGQLAKCERVWVSLLVARSSCRLKAKTLLLLAARNVVQGWIVVCDCWVCLACLGFLDNY